VADQPKARPRSRTRGQVTSNLQTDVSAEMPGHREVMPIDRRGLMTAAKRLARAAGALYLLVVVLAGIGQLGVRAGIQGGTPAPPWWRRVRMPRLNQLARLPRRSTRTV
jgi:hypothetical protein